MKKTLLFAICYLLFGGAHAANITIYYSPTCPHCHHAMEFFAAENIAHDKVNVMEPQNLDAFRRALNACEFTSGGVPVLVIGEKCFQGYAEFMNDDIRAAIAGDDARSQKKTDPAATDGNPMYFYIGLAIIVLGLGFVLLKKKK